MSDPTTTADAFGAFDGNLNLDEGDREAVIELHNDATDVMKDAGVITGSFLQGSFARKTMLGPLKDVDKVVILTSEVADEGPVAAKFAIEDALSPEYPTASFDHTKPHVVQVSFSDRDFYFDAVPAKEAEGDKDDDVLIVDTDPDTADDWKLANPRELSRRVSACNGATNGRFIHWVRMAKAAVHQIAGGDIPGLHVETWAYHTVSGPMADDEAIAVILAAAPQLIEDGYDDPTGIERLSDRLTDTARSYANKIADAADRAQDARKLTDADNHNEAIRIWHDLFGDTFPAPAPAPSRLERELRDSFQGRPVDRRRVVAPASRSWRQV